MFTKRAGVLACVAALALVTVACAQKQTPIAGASSGPVTLSLGTVPSSVQGNVVTIPVTVGGDFKIVKADGDTSGKSGHFHVFIDQQPVAAGQVIAKKRGIVHSTDNPIKIWGLAVGSHTFHVVLGDGTHKRIDGNVELSTTVDVKGPSVWGTVASSALTKGQDLVIQLHSEGFQVMPVAASAMTESASPAASASASAMSAGSQGHFHILVDPATPPKAGTTLPDPSPNKVIHTGASSVTISGLATGDHVIWIVGGDMTHRAFDPSVMDKLTVTVS